MPALDKNLHGACENEEDKRRGISLSEQYFSRSVLLHFAGLQQHLSALQSEPSEQRKTRDHGGVWLIHVTDPLSQFVSNLRTRIGIGDAPNAKRRFFFGWR